MKSIVKIVPWFGPWPKWFALYLESCRWNPTVDFVLISDSPPPPGAPPNVKFVTRSFADYRAFIAERLKIKPKWNSPYKLCDFKPTYGFLHPELVKGYDYWAYGDIDLVYGDIRKFLTDDVLDHDVISNHAHIVSGHFALIRNTPRMKRLFKRIWHWRYLLSAQQHKSFDERIFSLMFLDDERRKLQGVHRFLAPRIGGALLREQFSTPLEGLPWIDGSRNHPAEWTWRAGHLTASNAGAREFLYLHFTHWASSRWSGRSTAVWHGIDPLVTVTGAGPEAFTVSARGFCDPA